MADTQTPAPAPYVENTDHVPDPLAHVGTVDTSGTGVGPHTSIEGVNPAFDIERERLRLADGEEATPVADWYAKAAAAGGTEEYQADHTPEEPPTSQTFALSTDASETDLDPNQTPVTGTVDTSDTSGVSPSDQTAQGAVGLVEGRDDLSPAAVEANQAGNAGLDSSNRPEGDGGVAEPPAAEAPKYDDGLDDMTIAALRKLAGDQDPPVEIPSDTTKHDEIVAFLRSQGLRNPEAPTTETNPADGGSGGSNPS